MRQLILINVLVYCNERVPSLSCNKPRTSTRCLPGVVYLLVFIIVSWEMSSSRLLGRYFSTLKHKRAVSRRRADRRLACLALTMVNSRAVRRQTSSCRKIAGSQRGRVPFERFEGYVLAARFASAAERGDDSSVVPEGRRTSPRAPKTWGSGSRLFVFVRNFVLSQRGSR